MARLNIPWLALIPPIIFAILVAVFFSGMFRDDPEGLPSTHIGRVVPALELASLGDKVEPSAADLMASNIKIVNFWASWCVPCRLEHPHLVDLAAEGLPIIGVNYKDAPENALKFLSDLGDPYAVIGADPKGRNAFFWGVYGIPETFLVDEKGEVLLRHAGPITQDVLDTKIRPLVEAGRNSDQVGNE